MKKNEVSDLVGAFGEATSITGNLVALPLIFLIAGFFLDKTLSTTPIFIFLGIIVGVGLGIMRAMKISKNYKFKKSPKK